MSAVPRKILWADDEIDLLRPHILFLEQKGFVVTAVPNGKDAVAYAARETFDVVLLDEMMPGMGGLETLEAIKERDPTAAGGPGHQERGGVAHGRGDRARITDYLIKPVLPTQVFLA